MSISTDILDRLSGSEIVKEELRDTGARVVDQWTTRTCSEIERRLVRIETLADIARAAAREPRRPSRKPGSRRASVGGIAARAAAIEVCMSSIAQWPTGERPRERLIAHGAAALTDAELLSLVLGTGTPRATSLDVARDLLGRHRGLAGLFAQPVSSLAGAAGVGPAKAAKLKAGIELARRLLREEITHGSALTSPEAVRDYLRLTLASLPHEAFVVLFLDSQHRLLAADELFRGTLAQTSVYPREIVKAALARNAAAVIFAHNHPSGVAEPSRADELLTQALKQALALVDVRTLDHFVIAGHRVVSFAERGLI